MWFLNNLWLLKNLIKINNLYMLIKIGKIKKKYNKWIFKTIWKLK